MKNYYDTTSINGKQLVLDLLEGVLLVLSLLLLGLTRLSRRVCTFVRI